jgi:proliferating cell nuclear antigen
MPVLMRTEQGVNIRQAFESQKELVTDVNLCFNKSGMKMMTMDNSRVVFVTMVLKAENIETYEYNSKFPEITAGVTMATMFKLLRNVGTNDWLTLMIDEEDQANPSVMNVSFENQSQCCGSKLTIKLLHIENYEYTIPEKEFPAIVQMPTTTFQRIVRDAQQVADSVTITLGEKSIRFKYEGDIADGESVVWESMGGLTMNKNKQHFDPVSARFSLKYLHIFTKSTNMCNDVELMLTDEYPLVVKYQIGSLGYIKYCLAPKVDEEEEKPGNKRKIGSILDE